jgi:probable HAF family extracellular repeat protein
MSTRRVTHSAATWLGSAAVGLGALIIALGSPAVAGAMAPEPALQLHDLGTLGGATSQAVAMNNRGQVVGSSVTAEGSVHAFVWAPGARMMRDLGPGIAVDINSTGRVVGNDDNHVFVWAPREGRRELGTFGGLSASAADLNDRGQIAGTVMVPVESGFQSHAFRWDPRQGVRDLGPGTTALINRSGQVAGLESDMAGYLWDSRTGRTPIVAQPPEGVSGYLVEITGINDRAQVVGTALQAFRWDPKGGARSLDTLGAMSSGARDVNNRGQVVGRVQVPMEDVDHAYVWTAATGMVDLTTGADFAYNAEATAINERGDVAGWTKTGGGPPGGQAFLWQDSVGLRTLGTLGGDASTAVDVNEQGWVAGTATTSAGTEHAVVWCHHHGHHR